MFPFAAPAIIKSAGPILKPQDVFATNLYTGDGTNAPIVNGIDLLGRGGLVWDKTRNDTNNNYFIDTSRGASNYIASNLTNAEANASVLIPKFNTNGFNRSGYQAGTTAVSWSFARAAKFFDTKIFTHTNGTPTNIDLSSLGIIGDAVVKRRDAAGDWYAWHRSLTAGTNLRLNTAETESATSAFVSVSGTTLTFSASAPSGSYTYQARAHDPSADGIVQCGIVTTSGSGALSIPLPWLSQWVQLKSSGVYDDWRILDTTRPSGAVLRPNQSAAEIILAANSVAFTQTGITVAAGQLYPDAQTIVYTVIRASY